MALELVAQVMRKCNIANMNAKEIETLFTIEFLPLVPKAECGLFGVAEDFSEAFQSLDERFVKCRESTYFFEANGTSMEPTIMDGDILIVDRSIKSFQGRVCILSYEGEIICKRVFVKNGAVILRSDNHKFKDIIVRENMSSLLWGVVVGRCGDVR